MKIYTLLKKSGILPILLLLASYAADSQTVQTYNAAGTYSFTVPAGVLTVKAEAWGAGGKGGTKTTTYVSGGGGGGAYAKKATQPVVPGTTYTITVGAGSTSNSTAGEDSWFINTLTLLAKGGGSVPTNSLTGASGGSLVFSIGDLGGVFAGGNGAAGSPDTTSGNSGGGGSSAGSAAAGTNAVGLNGGNAPANGGDGGDGKGNGNGNGNDGTSPGGGGGGAMRKTGSTRNGGDGADGKVILTYTCPTYALTSAATSNGPLCGASASVVTLRSSSMLPGTYTVTYNLSGATTATGSTALMTFGLTGTGTFTTTSLNIGTTTVTVTNLTSASCTNSVSTNNTAVVTVASAPTANAGSAVSACSSSGAVNITAGSSASNATSTTWTSSGSGTFANASSLTTCTYTPSASDISAGSVTLTLTANGGAPCAAAIATKTLTIISPPTAAAGSAVSTCQSAASVAITAGSSASNYTSVTWTSSGTGTFTNPNSLTTCTYSPSAADKVAGSVTLTLTATAIVPCSGAATSTKVLTIYPNPSANPGSPITTCASSGAVNITTGASCSYYTSATWTSSGTGTFTNPNSLSTCTYNPSAADKTAGSVILTLTAYSPGCTNGTATKTLTIRPVATAVAGPNMNGCISGSINVTTGSSATNYSAVTWSSSGTGTFTFASSLTLCTYTPSAADITAGSVIITLTATGLAPCSDATSTKTLTLNMSAVTDAGTAVSTCATAGAVNITAGASAANYTSLVWTSSGSGTFANASSLTACTYTPSAADITAGSVTLTLTATNPGCGADTSTKTLTIYASPTVTSTTPATRTGTGTVILGAAASTGTLYWYAGPTGGSSLGFGSSFTTPVISVTTTFYVEVVNGPCISTPRTAVIATVNYPEIDIRGNAVSIVDGDIIPSAADWTDFGSANLTRTFTIYNTGAGVLSLGSVNISGANASEFAVILDPSTSVASGSSTTFTVAFTPTAAGTRSAVISISNNDTNENPYDFAIQGTGVAQEIDIQGNAVTITDGDTTPATADWTDFSTVTATRTFTIRNTGNIVLNLGAITITGANAADFSITTLPSSTVAAFSNTTFVVTFAPSAIANRTATINIANNDSNENPYDFAIQGFGVIPEIDIQGNATTIADGDTTPAASDWTDFGSGTVTRVFTIRNLGNTILTLGATSFTGTNPGDFAVTSPPSSPIPAFGATTFVITFTPGAIGARSAIFHIVNNDGNENPYDFTIQGTGVVQEIDVRGNAVSIADGDNTPATADWTDFSTTALTRTFTIYNTGNVALTVGAITFTGPNASDFSVTSLPAAIVPAFGNASFNVTFNPGGIGTRSAILHMVNNDGNENPYDFSIQGSGGIPEINVKSQYGVNIPDNSPSAVVTNQTNFGEISKDGGTVYTNVVIENLGTGALSLGAITITGANASEFAVLSAPAVSVIAPGAITSFKLSCTPTSVGVKNATVNIVNNDSDESLYDFAVSGTGVQTYKDTDGDGLTDNKDVDDDNDGIVDTQEQADGLAYPLTSTVPYVFLNETFGAGRTKGLININTPGATCNYCFEDRFGNGCSGSPTRDLTLEDGEYCVVYKITGPTSGDPENIHGDLAWYDGLDHTSGDTDGRMAVFNASFAPGTFYETRIDGVIPNVPVSYSFWVLNIMRQSNYGSSIRPNITVEFVDLSGNLISSFSTGLLGRCVVGNDADNSCALSNWLQFNTSVNLGDVTSFVVRFKNNSTGGSGNDLAIDDIKITQNYIDTDGDGIANIFDLDDENDGIPDIEEAGFKNYSSGLSKMDLTSSRWLDDDGDGLNDDIDNMIAFGAYVIPDSDGDGVPDYLDLDSDNDSRFDVDEAGIYNGDGDINGDGKGDLADTDKDGILDLYDNNTGFGTNTRAFAQDTDSNFLPDYLQLDSDGDGTKDIQAGLYGSLDGNNDGVIDGTADIDKDGLMDTFDTNTAVIGSPRDLNRKLFLDFDGRNDYGQGTGVLGGLSTVSMMAWVNLSSSFSATGVVVGQNNFQLKINSSKLLEVSVNGGSSTTYGTALVPARWYHVAAVLGAGSLKLYVNGVNVLTASLASSISADASLLTIGRNPSASNLFFKGKIDEVRIFNKNLTDAQLQRMVYQEIQNTASQVRGAIIPKDVGSLPWANLLRYYRMDAYKDDIIDDLTTASIDSGTGMKIYNHKNIYVQQAPMPFVTERTGDFATASNSPKNEVRGMDIMDQDWSIVQVKHNISESANNIDLGMLVDPGATITMNNDTKIQNDWYLLLNGKIDLQGKSQLVQTANSDLAPTSAGSIERDQQGQSSIYNYNYWSSPVSTVNATTNNTAFTVAGTMKDGTNPATPQAINWISGLNGSPTSPISICNYWIFKFQNMTPLYANWTRVESTGTLLPGQGYTMKGSGSALPTQNYTYAGKPNSGDITIPVAANNLNLSGNPYASAIDADAFINDNLSSTTGAIYFWEHFTTNSTHVLAQYQGGYATRTLVGGTTPVAPPGISGSGSSSRVPGRFIPVGQGFLVYGSNTGGNVAFHNSQRAFIKENNVSSNIMFRNVEESGPRATDPSALNREDDYTTEQFAKIRLGFDSASNYHREILLGFMNEHATSGIDAGYDGANIDNQPNDMYWRITTGNFAISGEGAFSDDKICPIGVKSGETGTVKISLDSTENFDENQAIYLYDNVTDQYHNLRTAPFEISMVVETIDSRYSLRFRNTSLAVTDFNTDQDIKVAYTSHDDMINIRNNRTDAPVEEVYMFNMLGQSISKWKVENQNQAKIEIPVSGMSAGTYIIKVHTAKGDISKKIIIR